MLFSFTFERRFALLEPHYITLTGAFVDIRVNELRPLLAASVAVLAVILPFEHLTRLPILLQDLHLLEDPGSLFAEIGERLFVCSFNFEDLAVSGQLRV